MAGQESWEREEKNIAKGETSTTGMSLCESTRPCWLAPTRQKIPCIRLLVIFLSYSALHIETGTCLFLTFWSITQPYYLHAMHMKHISTCSLVFAYQNSIRIISSTGPSEGFERWGG